MLGAPARRQPLAIHVGVQHENAAVDHHALLGRRQTLEHLVAVGDAVVLLRDDFGQQVVAGAGGVVIAVGPDRRTRIIGKQRPLELVTVVRPQRVGRRAHGVAHGIGALRIVRRPREDRNHDQPAIGQLVVAHHGVAVVAHAAANAEAGEDGVVGHGAIEQLAGGVVLLALLGEDGHVAVQDLEDMVGADRQADIDAAASSAAAASVGIGCVAAPGNSWPVKPSPRPSKLATGSIAARLPCVVCSTAAPAALISGAGGGGGIGGGPPRPCPHGRPPAAAPRRAAAGGRRSRAQARARSFRSRPAVPAGSPLRDE